jgi:hypothetical protein
MCPLLVGGYPCPIKSFMGTENQSSVQAAGVLNDASVPDTWDSAGLLAFQHRMSMIIGSVLASRIMTPLQSFENALTGYHSLLLQKMQAQKQHDQQWDRYTFARRTLRTLLSICGHTALRYPNWSIEWPWDPSRTQEDGSEINYSETKKGSRGVCTLKLRMRNTDVKHWKQARAFSKGLLAEIAATREGASQQQEKGHRSNKRRGIAATRERASQQQEKGHRSNKRKGIAATKEAALHGSAKRA